MDNKSVTEKRISWFVGIIVVACLSACGGGGGGNNDNPPANTAPVANAGSNVTANANDTVNLDGSASSDSDGSISSYAWSQTQGANVTLSSSSVAQPSFTAPAVGATLVFQLTVTDDDGASDTDSVTITINGNTTPSANAGADATADASSVVTLDGTASTDSDGSIASYAWTQLQGQSVSLSAANIAQPMFTAPGANGILVFQLIVTDNEGATDSDQVAITVENGVVQTVGLDARPSNMSCVAPATPGSAPSSLDLVDVFPNLPMPSFPMGLHQLPGNDNYFYVTTRAGQVLRFDNDPGANATILVLDISGQVDFLNNLPPGAAEGGLLGFAFHPQVATNGAVYIYYTTYDSMSGEGFSRISRFTMTNDAAIDPVSERIVLELEQPFSNHNGGDIHFGPDGYLYIAFGDGGSSNDPLGSGQDINTLLGALLRIDVDPTTTVEFDYDIPPDNPFASSGGADEIYAYGLRNPFRFSFDGNVLWLADVGQSSREEVNHIVNGGNYGWDDMEGNVCRIADCSAFEAPIHDYPRTAGTSITGGYVYRGTEIPGLDGVYIFGDYGSGSVFTLTPNGGGYTRSTVASASTIIGFARDNDGEVYILTGFGRTIRKIQSSSASTSNIPELLSDTGCKDDTNIAQPADGLIPFDVISPLWSDGAQKDRWMALPNSETVDVDADGDFDFPEGTILVKDFSNAGTMIETRLLMRHQTGWAGYSYKWRDDQSDADLLPGADTDNVAGLNWHFPSRGQCQQCHTPVKNFALGPEVLQLNHEFLYEQTGRTANQVYTLDQIGVFSAPPGGSLNTATLFALDDTNATLEQRVKSYLHSNCSQCHQPGGTGEGGMDFRFETPFAQMNVCNVTPQENFGNANARFIAPGSPANSMILTRMQSTFASGNRMPPLATEVVDSEAVDVFTDWIISLSSCP